MSIKILNGHLEVVNKFKSLKQNGFTLIEITIAVFMLASSLVVMLGLEQSNMTRTINDQNRKVALGLARKVMSYIELQKVNINIDEEKADKIINFFSQNNIEYDKDDKDVLDKYDVNLKATSAQISGFEQDNLIKLIELKISWGPSHREELSVIRFVENI